MKPIQNVLALLPLFWTNYVKCEIVIKIEEIYLHMEIIDIIKVDEVSKSVQVMLRSRKDFIFLGIFSEFYPNFKPKKSNPSFLLKVS